MITDVQAYHADKKDSRYLQDTARRLIGCLRREGLIWENALVDAGYSSGKNYAYFENKGIRTYFPSHGTYNGGPEGFQYNKDGNYWLCPQGKKVTFCNEKIENVTLK